MSPHVIKKKKKIFLNGGVDEAQINPFKIKHNITGNTVYHHIVIELC